MKDSALKECFYIREGRLLRAFQFDVIYGAAQLGPNSYSLDPSMRQGRFSCPRDDQDDRQRSISTRRIRLLKRCRAK